MAWPQWGFYIHSPQQTPKRTQTITHCCTSAYGNSGRSTRSTCGVLSSPFFTTVCPHIARATQADAQKPQQRSKVPKTWKHLAAAEQRPCTPPRGGGDRPALNSVRRAGRDARDAATKVWRGETSLAPGGRRQASNRTTTERARNDTASPQSPGRTFGLRTPPCREHRIAAEPRTNLWVAYPALPLT